MNAIETSDLSKTFHRGKRLIVAVDKLSFSVPSGVVFGYVGPNGSGKTTTIRMLCGLLPASSGTAWVAGKSLREPDEVKARIGYAGQNTKLYADLSVEENLRFIAELYLDPQPAKAAVTYVMTRLNLEDLRSIPAKQLSGGWRQRLNIATALVHEPGVVFLDEPTAKLDPVGRRELWDVIYALNADGITVFVSTHMMEEAEHCHRVAMIFDGKLLATGTPKALRENTSGYFYRLEPRDPLAVFKAAKQLPQVRDVWLRGNTIRLAAKQPLTCKQILDAPLQAVSPDLEDTFISLTETHGLWHD